MTLLLAGACSFRDGTAAVDAFVSNDVAIDSSPTTGSLFVPDFMAGSLHRFAVAEGAGAPPPPLTMSIANAESPVVRAASGELLLGQYTTSTVLRYTTPLATPTASGAITANGLSTNFGKMIAVDDEIWIVLDGATNGVDRLAFASGTATMAGAFAVTNPRGIVFDPVTRDLYITQCCGTDTILHFRVAANRSLVAMASLSGNGLDNPHGMALAPWGELFVANANTNEILRFTRDATGALAANGSISGNGLMLPIDIALATWGELYVANQGASTVSRFTLDATHRVTANGMFAVPGGQKLGWMALVE